MEMPGSFESRVSFFYKVFLAAGMRAFSEKENGF